jgi:hypothetical protein
MQKDFTAALFPEEFAELAFGTAAESHLGRSVEKEVFHGASL